MSTNSNNTSSFWVLFWLFIIALNSCSPNRELEIKIDQLNATLKDIRSDLKAIKDRQ